MVSCTLLMRLCAKYVLALSGKEYFVFMLFVTIPAATSQLRAHRSCPVATANADTSSGAGIVAACVHSDTSPPT